MSHRVSGSLDNSHLFLAEGGVFSGYALSLCVCKRIEHAVVRVDRWQSILSQLVVDELHNLGHSCLIVTPVTDNLHVMLYTHVVLPDTPKHIWKHTHPYPHTHTHTPFSRVLLTHPHPPPHTHLKAKYDSTPPHPHPPPPPSTHTHTNTS